MSCQHEVDITPFPRLACGTVACHLICHFFPGSSTIPTTRKPLHRAAKIGISVEKTSYSASAGSSLENCIICLEEITDPKTLTCSHTFCKNCAEKALKTKNACPVCGKVQGLMTGNQPDGEMSWFYSFDSLPGYTSCGTIKIDYCFPNGTQKVI